MRAVFVCVLIATACSGACSRARSQSPVEQQAGSSGNTPHARSTIGLVELAAAGNLPKLTNVDVDDPVYATRMRYEGYALADVLHSTVSLDERDTDADEVFFQCADGYTPSMPLRVALSDGGVLATRDRSVPRDVRWKPFRHGKEMITPGPFYLVWPSDPDKHIWPYQIQSLVVANRDEVYKPTYPSQSPQAELGYRLFRGNCIACHSINLVGGALGPELNIPKNVTEYWDDATLRALIRDASAFRARSKMPAFPSFSPSDIEAIVGYLRDMASRKISIRTS